MTNFTPTTANVILLGEYGSTAMGVSNDSSDHDLMGAYVPPQAAMFGLTRAISIRESEAADGARSAPGEYDTTLHPAQKFGELLANGNPTMIQLLFLREYQILREEGQWFIDERDAFVAKKTLRAYLGYMNAQISSMDNDRKQRPELVELHGYDTKFAYHAARLGMQGVELATTGGITVPMFASDRYTLKGIREGYYNKGDMLAKLIYIRQDLERAVIESDLPELPDYARINKLLVDVHKSWYRP